MIVITGEKIQQLIAQQIGFANICIPSIIMMWYGSYEADLIYISKRNYLTEVEIKISMSDFYADFKKKMYHSSPNVRNFYYAFHEDFYLANRDKIDGKLDGTKTGIITVSEKEPFIYYWKRARARKGVKPLTTKELYHFMRLGCMKWFVGKHKKMA